MSKGVILSLVASALFGVLYFYATLLAPLTGEAIFGWRLALTFPCVTTFLVLSGQSEAITRIARRVRARPGLLPALLLSSALIAVQLWLFMWAPLHGRALQVSLGYFLLPLSMILIGRVVYGERLSRLRLAATAFAGLGAGYQLLLQGGFSWETLVVALGYPCYFVLRRRLDTANLGGLWFDMALMLPAALWFLVRNDSTLSAFAVQPWLWLLVPGMGLLSALALICYIASSRLLALNLFGLLGYVEPVLLVGVALLLGEQIAPEQWPTYIAIWMALGLLVLEGIRHVRGLRLRKVAHVRAQALARRSG